MEREEVETLMEVARKAVLLLALKIKPRIATARNRRGVYSVKDSGIHQSLQHTL